MAVELEKLGELLERIGDSSQPISMTWLYYLSDLTGKHLSEVRAAWPDMEPSRRRHVARSLVELAEANFEVNFDSIFVLLLEDPDEEVRAAGIDGLWENEDVALIGPLLSMMRHDPAARVRASAATGLGHYVLAGELEQLKPAIHNRLVAELLAVLQLADEEVEVRRRAIEAAAYACTDEIREMIELAYYDEDPDMQLSALVGMGRSCDRRWQRFILQELDSAVPAMRYEAAWASGELALQQAVPVLARLILDPDRQVCIASIWALGQIGGPEAKEILLEAYEDADEDARVAIDEALAELALYQGDLEFTLYDFEADPDMAMMEDDLDAAWEAGDHPNGSPDDDWD